MLPARLVLVVACMTVFAVPPSRAAIITLDANADTYIRSGNANEGTATFLRVRRTGTHRALVRFNQAAIASAVGSGILQSATLQLFLESNSDAWSTGREIDVHRVLENWTELGATYNCGVDTDTSNAAADCAVQWNGGNFAAGATATYLQTNGMLGNVSLDVTADVAAFLSSTANFGWIIKKRIESQNGAIDYTSREGSASQRPKLVLDVFFPPTNTPTITPTSTPTNTPTLTPTFTPTNTPTNTPNLNCDATPLIGCRQSIQSNKSALQMVKKGGTKDRLVFKWIKGEATGLADLGNPSAATTYTMCIYDQTANVSSLVQESVVPPGGTCNNRPCWKSTSKGYKYSDRLLSNDGIKIINLKSGAAGKAKIILKGQGPGLALPTLPLAQDQVVIAQLKNDLNAGECWEARFSGPATRSDTTLFKDKGDAPITFAPTATQTHTHTVPPTFTPTATPAGSAATATATGTATDTPTAGPVTSTPTATPTATVNARVCELNSPISRLFLQLSGSGVLIRPSGSIAVGIGATNPVTGQRPMTCDVIDFDAIPLLGIGDVCVAPAGPCDPGVQLCGATLAPLDMRVRGDHNIGACTSQTTCAASCNAHCSTFGAGYALQSSSCEGFCDAGTNHNGACSQDDQCPGGTCPGKEPAQGGVHAGVCNCTCLGQGLGSNAAQGAMSCRLGMAITVERDNDQICGNVAPAITLSPLCGGLTTATAIGQSLRANNNLGSGNSTRLPPTGINNPMTKTGALRSCPQIDSDQLTGLKYVGYLVFYDSSLGDILAEEEFFCQ